MSYTVNLRCASCHRSSRSSWGPTYNLAQIFDLALTGEPWPSEDTSEASRVLFHKPVARPRGLCILDGKRAGDTVELLTKALERMRDPSMRAQFLALNPANGWGTLDGATEDITSLLEAAIDDPSSVWSAT